jgi:hypothetical protein
MRVARFARNALRAYSVRKRSTATANANTQNLMRKNAARLMRPAETRRRLAEPL